MNNAAATAPKMGHPLPNENTAVHKNDIWARQGRKGERAGTYGYVDGSPNHNQTGLIETAEGRKNSTAANQKVGQNHCSGIINTINNTNYDLS